jgi:hypothetical protein
MRAILFIYLFIQKSFACIKIIFFRLQKCKNWSQKKKNNNSGTCDNGFFVFKIFLLKKLTKISQRKNRKMDLNLH